MTLKMDRSLLNSHFVIHSTMNKSTTPVGLLLLNDRVTHDLTNFAISSQWKQITYASCYGNHFKI